MNFLGHVEKSMVVSDQFVKASSCLPFSQFSFFSPWLAPPIPSRHSKGMYPLPLPLCLFFSLVESSQMYKRPVNNIMRVLTLVNGMRRLGQLITALIRAKSLIELDRAHLLIFRLPPLMMGAGKAAKDAGLLAVGLGAVAAEPTALALTTSTSGLLRIRGAIAEAGWCAAGHGAHQVGQANILEAALQRHLERRQAGGDDGQRELDHAPGDDGQRGGD